ncbi:hypothetical protein ABT160_33140 [Streptomyces sp. NPDC001941]|uniref:hypothetical protein n=1 Tax=Streptomyces sp. NPDC001941 TaxID=3154659 RepID=UPI00331CFD60
MTTVSSETTTERTPGRAWTIRLTGHSDRTATLSCSTGACRMPARSRDLAALRAFAARHAQAHARAATVRPHASCHCRAEQCAAHSETRAYCAGAVLLILRHDASVGRVWSVEEVCEACAPLIPHAAVVARAVRPRRTVETPAPPSTEPAAARPIVPGGFSSPTAGSMDDVRAPNVRRPRRTAKRRD